LKARTGDEQVAFPCHGTQGRTRHQRIDGGVVPHIERTCGPRSGSYAKKSNDSGKGIDAAWRDQDRLVR
jgi:hypothetical protein